MSIFSGAQQPLLERITHAARSAKRELNAIGTYRQQRSMKKPDGPIRVGFLCDYTSAWSKVKPIYDMMEKDERFAPVILCVPSNLQYGKVADPANLHNDVFDFFIENGYPNALNTLIGPDQWLDLEKLELSYIFYLRPYNYLLPPPYENHRVCRYTKVCMVIYGMSMTKEVGDAVMERDFFRHVYCYFAETSFAMEKNRADGWLLHQLGLQKSVFKGLPGMEEIAASQHKKSDAWDFYPSDFRVMWTPRWTTNPELGGSNFFEYGEYLMDFARENPQTAMLFRPHPMMLQNFISTGELTREQAERFRERCDETPNLSLDERPEYMATMWQSSVLVTDISGVMAEYFVMGKPMIYCASNMHLTPAGHTEKMLEGCYVVHNWRQLKDTLLGLQQGIDPLAEKRKELAREIYGSLDSRPSAAVLEELVEDYHQ